MDSSALNVHGGAVIVTALFDRHCGGRRSPRRGLDCSRCSERTAVRAVGARCGHRVSSARRSGDRCSRPHAPCRIHRSRPRRGRRRRCRSVRPGIRVSSSFWRDVRISCGVGPFGRGHAARLVADRRLTSRRCVLDHHRELRRVRRPHVPPGGGFRRHEVRGTLAAWLLVSFTLVRWVRQSPRSVMAKRCGVPRVARRRLANAQSTPA